MLCNTVSQSSRLFAEYTDLVDWISTERRCSSALHSAAVLKRITDALTVSEAAFHLPLLWQDVC